MKLLEEAGLFMGPTRAGQAISSLSEVIKQHLLQTVKALMVYKSIAMDSIRKPAHTCLIWTKKGERANEWREGARDGRRGFPLLSNAMEYPYTELRSWSNAKWIDFGPNGWDKLVGDVDIHHTIDGDHYSIVPSAIHT